MPDKLILLMHESWNDLDRAISGLAPKEATRRHDGGSSIAWTVGHVTNLVDSWINARLQGLPSHPVISDPMIRTGGGGDAHNWPAILAGMSEVREASKRFLDSKPEPDLDRTIPYDGAIDYLHPIGLSLRYALMRVAAHHFVHAGEIVTIRYLMGHPAEDFKDWGQALV
ncbi:MAG: DinB family protein [Chloroflexi bacterium]|nr:MAG: DinB family protein [Chloroflexota bacterium]